MDVHQRLKITSLTFLFTDLRGSTELYERPAEAVSHLVSRGVSRSRRTRTGSKLPAM
jgi:class 3 adenylate cyclase